MGFTTETARAAVARREDRQTEPPPYVRCALGEYVNGYPAAIIGARWGGHCERTVRRWAVRYAAVVQELQNELQADEWAAAAARDRKQLWRMRNRQPTDETVMLLDRIEATLHASIEGVPVNRLYPWLVSPRKRWHGITVRKAHPAGEVPYLVSQAIRFRVEGQSYRWIARRLSVDKMTVVRWVNKHPCEVRRMFDARWGGSGGWLPFT